MRQEAIEKLVENIIKSLAELIIDVGSPVPDAEWRTAVEWAFQEAKVKAADSILALTQPTLPEITDIGGRDIPKIVKDLEAAKLSSLFSYRQAYLVGANAMRDLCIETLQKQTLAMMRNPEKAKARDILRMSRK